MSGRGKVFLATISGAAIASAIVTAALMVANVRSTKYGQRIVPHIEVASLGRRPASLPEGTPAYTVGRTGAPVRIVPLWRVQATPDLRGAL